MAMSRRHYEDMAETVRCLRWSISSRSEWEAVRDEIAATYARDNVHFSRERFIAACENHRFAIAAEHNPNLTSDPKGSSL